MSSPPRTETNSQLMLEVLRKCLPVRKRRELLTALAGCWRDATRDDWTLVAAELPRSEEFSCLLSGPQGLVEYRELLVPAQPGSLETRLKFPLREAFPEAAVEWFVRDLSTRDVIGGVVAGSRPFPDDADDLAVLSAALLTQLREIETALPNGIGMDWFNRRKLESLIEFAAGAGHEINNPVAAISGRVQLLLRQESDPERARQLAAIGSNALRISHMIGDTMQFAEPPPMHRERCELGESIKTVLDKLQQRFIEQNVEIKLTRPRELFVDADRNQLETVIAELLLNGLNAQDGGGTVRVRIAPPDHSRSAFATLEVSDNGPGLTELDRRHLFDPFYSGRQAGRGLGFGLCKCWRIVTRHGGTIDVASVPWVATTFTVHWPTA
jgi:signal transduction histidine kinase